ncbi:MAG: hypothetical protein ACR2KP_02300 [Egibacteraceae bacterium]
MDVHHVTADDPYGLPVIDDAMSRRATSAASSVTDSADSSMARADYRFTVEEFVRAWEAGAFSQRVELVDGQV